MAGSIVVTVYLNEVRHKEYEKDKTKYNKVARVALIDSLDVATTVVEEDLLEVAQKEIDEERKDKEQMKDLIEETPVKPIETEEEEKKNGFFKRVFK